MGENYFSSHWAKITVAENFPSICIQNADINTKTACLFFVVVNIWVYTCTFFFSMYGEWKT